MEEDQEDTASSTSKKEAQTDWGAALFYCAFTGIRMSSSVAAGICGVLAYTNTRDLLLYYPRLAFKRGAVKRRYDYQAERLGTVTDEPLCELYSCWEMILFEAAKEILYRYHALDRLLPLSATTVDKLNAMMTPTELHSILESASGATSSEVQAYGEGVLTKEQIADVIARKTPSAEQKTIAEEDMEPKRTPKRRAEVEEEAEEASSGDEVEVEVEASDESDDSDDE
jgi:hypothetical protein